MPAVEGQLNDRPGVVVEGVKRAAYLFDLDERYELSIDIRRRRLGLVMDTFLASGAGTRPTNQVDGEPVRAGTIYVAPGGWHMRVMKRDDGAVIALGDGPAANFCKPAVDPLFASAAAVWGPKVLALVLTGMGSDGLNGGNAIVAAGGSVIAQDEATSVVWGMPGQVAMAGLCSAVLPINEIAPRLTRLFAGDRA